MLHLPLDKTNITSRVLSINNLMYISICNVRALTYTHNNTKKKICTTQNLAQQDHSKSHTHTHHMPSLYPHHCQTHGTLGLKPPIGWVWCMYTHTHLSHTHTHRHHKPISTSSSDPRVLEPKASDLLGVMYAHTQHTHIHPHTQHTQHAPLTHTHTHNTTSLSPHHHQTPGILSPNPPIGWARRGLAACLGRFLLGRERRR